MKLFLRVYSKCITKAQNQRRGLTDIAHILENDVPYFNGVKQVRWLASRHRAIEALIKHLYVSVKHLETVDKEKAKDLLTNLKNAYF